MVGGGAWWWCWSSWCRCRGALRPGWRWELGGFSDVTMTCADEVPASVTVVIRGRWRRRDRQRDQRLERDERGERRHFLFQGHVTVPRACYGRRAGQRVAPRRRATAATAVAARSAAATVARRARPVPAVRQDRRTPTAGVAPVAAPVAASPPPTPRRPVPPGAENGSNTDGNLVNALAARSDRPGRRPRRRRRPTLAVARAVAAVASVRKPVAMGRGAVAKRRRCLVLNGASSGAGGRWWRDGYVIVIAIVNVAT